MNVLESSAYYIWWLKNHHSTLPLEQVQEEVEGVFRSLRSFHFFSGIEESVGIIYLQELRMFNCNVNSYEKYLNAGKPILASAWPLKKGDNSKTEDYLSILSEVDDKLTQLGAQAYALLKETHFLRNASNKVVAEVLFPISIDPGIRAGIRNM